MQYNQMTPVLDTNGRAPNVKKVNALMVLRNKFKNYKNLEIFHTKNVKIKNKLTLQPITTNLP